MKVRICFGKTEAGSYLSHLDLARTIERSLRRAKAPLAFSEGFNPHPKVSIASALAVGTTGRREYLDLELSGRVELRRFGQDLERAFPPALAFVAAEEIMQGGKSLSAVVNLAVYRLCAEVRAEDEEKANTGLASVLAAKELWRKPKEKPGKKTTPAKEVRGLIKRAEFTSSVQQSPPSRHLTLEMELRMKADGSLRPQELWEMVASAGGFEPAPPLSICRLALLIQQEGKVFSPMEGVDGWYA